MSDNDCNCELVVDNTVDGKDTKEEKTRVVANIMMYHFSRNFFQQGCDNMLWWIGDGGWQESCSFFQDVWPYQGHVC